MDTQSALFEGTPYDLYDRVQEVMVKRIENGYVLRWEPEQENVYGPVHEFYAPTLQTAVEKLERLLG